MAIPYKFLLRTAENGNCNELSRIIESGCNLNYQKKKSGKTALMLAVQRGKLEAVKLLTGAGADLNLRDKYGETALMMAALRGLASIARYLAEQGANVDIQDNFRQSALMRAAQRNDMAMAEILISAGANLNQQDQSGLKVFRRHASFAPQVRSRRLINKQRRRRLYLYSAKKLPPNTDGDKREHRKQL